MLATRGLRFYHFIILIVGFLLSSGQYTQGMTLADLAHASSNNFTGIFNSTTSRGMSFETLPKWKQLIRKMKSEEKIFRNCAVDAKNCTTEGLKRWRDMIIYAAGLDKREQPRFVNGFFNEWRHASDVTLYGQQDYLATPHEFLEKSGDCEDYTIAKLAALHHLGYTDREMRIVILRDVLRGVWHAVLAVHLENDILILDSLSDYVLSHKFYAHYQPKYSLNESKWWVHSPATQTPQFAQLQ